jgi:hypothetical protein
MKLEPRPYGSDINLFSLDLDDPAKNLAPPVTPFTWHEAEEGGAEEAKASRN